MSNKIRFAFVVAVVAALCSGTPARAEITMEIQSLSLNPGGTLPILVFPGDNTFNFQDASGGLFAGYDFAVTDVGGSDGTGTAVGLLGNIGGTYTIGAITVDGNRQSAPVTGSGTFSIDDGAGNLLTADIAFLTIFTDGEAGNVNAGGTLNLTNVSYSGTNADLLTLEALSPGTLGVSFNFTPARTLTELANSPQDTTNWNGDLIAAVPAPAGLLLLAAGAPILGLGYLRRRKVAVKA
jgi:hypothetical protein